jgi:hypothetical protein
VNASSIDAIVIAENDQGLQGFADRKGSHTISFSTLNRSALVDIPFTVDSLPYGWISQLEAQILYNMALVSEGPIIEIGSFIGRSTCAIASGVRDNKGDILFDVFDLGYPWGLDDPKASPIVRETVKGPSGVPALLIQNIHDRGLREAVNMFAFCDFKRSSVSRTYTAAFCDACHTKSEIDLNVPTMMSLIDRDDYLVVFDDIWSLEACDYVTKMVGAQKSICLGGDAGDGQCKISIMARGKYAQLPWFA